MSCDFAVWFPHQRLSDSEAGDLFGQLLGGDTRGVQPHPAVDAFYAELIAKHPEINTLPVERLDDSDYCPWSGPIDHSPGHVIVQCVWSQAENAYRQVHNLARKHGLAVFDPQSNSVTYPDDSLLISERKYPWMKKWW